MAMGLATSERGKRPRPVPVVNVTPLVDVALVVLIIFMVVMPMMMKSFWLNVPKKDDQAELKPPPTGDANKPLVLTIERDGAYRINHAPIAAAELQTRLPRMLAAKDQKVLYFDAHDDIGYGKVVEALDLSRAAGARSIAILTQKVVK
jgi:biopolymer transport protein ExbD